MNWGVVEAQPRGAPTLTTGTHPKMLTRKQRWRRTRTRKNAWGNLPPEVLDAMLAGGGGMPKSVSWDHSYAAGLKIRADAAAEAARRAAKEDSRLKAAAAAAAVRGGPIPRSVSCSSLAPKRTLFPRSNSKDELGTRPRRGSGPPTGRHIGRDMLPHRRGVSFDTQVRGRFGGLSCRVLTGCRRGRSVLLRSFLFWWPPPKESRGREERERARERQPPPRSGADRLYTGWEVFPVARFVDRAASALSLENGEGGGGARLMTRCGKVSFFHVVVFFLQALSVLSE